MIKYDKNSTREIYKLVRNEIKDKDSLSKLICRRLTESDIYKSCDTVFLYASVGSEVSTVGIMNKAIEDGKRVAYPRCADKNGNMEFYFVSSPNELQNDFYGIPAPPDRFPAGFGNEKSLCIVPGLAFSADGYRIGYGKGYYDRFLSRFKGISAGICYSQCLVSELPTDENDKKVDYLITDKKIYNFT